MSKYDPENWDVLLSIVKPATKILSSTNSAMINSRFNVVAPEKILSRIFPYHPFNAKIWCFRMHGSYGNISSGIVLEPG